jgi:hypothetical protein
MNQSDLASIKPFSKCRNRPRLSGIGFSATGFPGIKVIRRTGGRSNSSELRTRGSDFIGQKYFVVAGERLRLFLSVVSVLLRVGPCTRVFCVCAWVCVRV